MELSGSRKRRRGPPGKRRGVHHGTLLGLRPAKRRAHDRVPRGAPALARFPMAARAAAARLRRRRPLWKPVSYESLKAPPASAFLVTDRTFTVFRGTSLPPLRRPMTGRGKDRSAGSCTTTPAGFCRRWVPFWADTLRKRGFVDRAASERVGREKESLSVPGEDLLFDLRLLLADGGQVRGADVYRHVMKRIWWAYPIYLLSVAPILRRIFDRAYLGLPRTIAIGFRVRAGFQGRRHEGIRRQTGGVSSRHASDAFPPRTRPRVPRRSRAAVEFRAGACPVPLRRGRAPERMVLPWRVLQVADRGERSWSPRFSSESPGS